MPAAFPGNSTTKLARAATGGGFESAIEAEQLSGGTSALAWEAPAVGHGEDLTLSTDGALDFGTRSHIPQKHYQEGDQLWLDGVLQTSTEEGLTDGATVTSSSAFPYVWPASGVTADRVDTLANSNFSYDLKLVGEGIRYPAGQGSASPIPKTTNRVYVSWHSKQTTDINKIREADYSTIDNGPFSDNGNYTIGEELTVTNNLGGTSTGRVIWVDTANSKIYFESDLDGSSADWGNDNYAAPATLEGLTSGAVANLAGNSGRASSSKRQRLETPNLSPAEIQVTVGNTIVFETLAGIYDSPGPHPRAVGWEYQSTAVVASGTDVTATLRTGEAEQVLGPHPLGQNAADINNGIGLGPHVNDYAGKGKEGHGFKACNHVYDDLPARVMLTNGSTWAGSTKFSDCLIKSWGSLGATVRQNHGDFLATDPIYIYVFDNDDVRLNSNGVLLRAAT